MLLDEASSHQMFQLPSIDDLPLPSVERMIFKKIESFQNNDIQNFRIEFPKVQQLPVKQTNITESEKQASNGESHALVVKGLWSREEDEMLRKAVEGMSPIVWDVVAEKVPGRNAIQCRDRWRYRLCPEVKKTRFEGWEDVVIMREQKRIGNRWTLIANKLPGRTACAVKNRWYSVLRNVCSE